VLNELLILEVDKKMVNVAVKKLSSYKRELTLTMDKADLEPIKERQIKKVRKEIAFPGFRKGKAPIGMIKSTHKELIEAYTLEAAADESLRTALMDEKIEPVSQPEAKGIDLDENGNLVTVIELDTYPDIELKKVKGFEVIRDKYIIKDSYIESEIKKLLKSKATLNPSEGAAKEGDIITVDLSELDEKGKPLKDKVYNDLTITLGDGQFDVELEKLLLELKNGETKEIEKVYPDDFPQKEFAGKKERYTVTVKNLEVETLPELNDEFVKTIDEKLESVEMFRKETQKRLEQQHNYEADMRFNSDLAQQLIEENPIEMPEGLIENYLNNIVRDMKARDPKIKEADIRQYYRGEAEFQLKLHYIKEQVIKEEKLEVTDEDIKKAIDAIEDEKMKELYELNAQFKESMREQEKQKKVDEFLKENSKITDNEIILD
jgi:trigger factor